MSYLVLARKWRPKSFETLIGQEHVVRALTHALETGRLHHAYLFTGTRGIGKTTLARILAKALNCESGVTPRPCGVCGACQEIDGGRFVDYLELDAASNRGVDEMAQLLEQSVYAPTRGRFKVFVIDEVHQLTGHAFNAMLKTLEEPPEHVKFILATTDPQKIPVTVLSRCLQFNLKQMPPQHIVDHLARVLEAEQIPFEPPALRQLAKAAAGSMRDALSLLDQAIAHGAGKVEEEGVRDMLGTVGEDHVYAVLDGLAAADIHAMLAVADAMDIRSLSFDSALQELGRLLHRVALLQLAPGAIVDEGERARLAPYAKAFDAEFLQLAYQIALQGRADLALAPDEYAGFAMTLLRLAAFRPEMPAALGAATALSAAAAAAREKRAEVKPALVVAKSPAPEPVPPPGKPAAEPTPAASAASAIQPPAFERETPPPIAAAEPAPLTAPPATAEPPASGAEVDWRQLIGALKLGGMVRELAQHCEWLGLEDGAARLRLSPTHRALMTKAAMGKLESVLTAHFARTVTLKIDLATPEAATPAQQLRSEQQERHNAAVAALEQDGFVRDMIDMFDATINESTIKPL